MFAVAIAEDGASSLRFRSQNRLLPCRPKVPCWQKKSSAHESSLVAPLKFTYCLAARLTCQHQEETKQSKVIQLFCHNLLRILPQSWEFPRRQEKVVKKPLTIASLKEEINSWQVVGPSAQMGRSLSVPGIAWPLARPMVWNCSKGWICQLRPYSTFSKKVKTSMVLKDLVGTITGKMPPVRNAEPSPCAKSRDARLFTARDHWAIHNFADTMAKGTAAILGLLPKHNIVSRALYATITPVRSSSAFTNVLSSHFVRQRRSECHRSLWEGENHRRGHLWIIVAMSGKKRWLQDFINFNQNIKECTVNAKILFT